MLGLILFYNLVRLHRQVFGESMMFLYYAYLFPLSRTIGRGFYEDGIWADARSSRTTKSAASAGAKASTR